MKRLFLAGIFLLLFSNLTVSTHAQLTRVANTSLKLPQTPETRGYTLQQAFGRTFTAPVAVVTPPGETNRVFVVEQRGRIIMLTNITDAMPTATTFLDIGSKTTFSGEQGLLGLAFHPNFQENGLFFIFYTTSSSRADRVSRYKVSATDPTVADPASETIILSQRDEWTNHNAGDLHFGPDGYLYISLGDEGDANDSNQNSQRIDKDFFSGILRIDVDKKPGNLTPAAHPAVTTNYFVPADNPFVGATSFNGVALADPSKVHAEFWAVGLRNPWRFSIDPATGTMWCGDVGQGAREEVDIIVKGGNYGWNFREGFIPRPGSDTNTVPAGAQFIDPVHDYPRTSAGGQAVIGGVVYHGSRIAQLDGAYIFGDNDSGNIWSLRLDSANKATVQRLTVNTGVSAFGIDPANGDVLVCDVVDGNIRRLVYSDVVTGNPFPPTLADTGAFSDVPSLRPQPGIVPYELNLPFWSDGAKKTRWFSVPKLTDKLTFNDTNNWSAPTGTVWIKHFDMQMTVGDPSSVRRLETRFIVRTTNGVYGIVYRWTNQLGAVLVPDEGLNEELVINEGGATRTQVWHYPSRSECLQCHNSSANWALGFSAPQLNRTNTYGSLTTNQISALAAAGYFSNPPDSPHDLLAIARPDDASVSQEWRVRSYLAANCAQCHRPGGPGLANFDTRLSTPSDASQLLNGAVNNTLGDPANRTLAPNSPEHSVILTRISTRGEGQMPPIASNVPDAAGIELIRSFIVGDLATRQSFADWQVAKFNEPLPPEAAATADPDADGASNMLEYLTGGNPAQPGDAWGVVAAVTGNSLQINFQNPANRSVIIESTTGFGGTWTPIDHPDNRPLFPAVAGPRTITATVGSDVTRFYRATISAP